MDGRRARAVLGVGGDAGPDEIRRAFRARAFATHPDHGGNAAEFAAVQHAFAVLRDVAPTHRIRPTLLHAHPHVDVYDSPVRPRPERVFSDVLRAATARLR
jgi:hypothetical protein